MKLSVALAIGAFCAGAVAAISLQPALAADAEPSLLRTDRAAFGLSSVKLDDNLLDPNFTWTDSEGTTRNKFEITRALRSAKKPSMEIGGSDGAEATIAPIAIKARTYGQVGVVQEHSGDVYILRIWINHDAGWKLLVYQAVSIGAPPSAKSEKEECENPCNRVPFKPQSDDQREVIQAYQAVQRAVTAHDSAAWGAHIAAEFFAVTSNSDRPLDKAARMAGLDSQKVGGIAPFPLVSARMFEVGDAMVMISRQQPKNGLRLRVTRIWIKRNGAWLEAYSYQTTIRPRFIG